MDQVFDVRQVCEKYLANRKDVFWASVDFEKAYETIDRHGMWQMIRVYGVGGKLLKPVQSIYVYIRACVRVGMDVRELFPVNAGLSANGGRFEINLRLFADDTSLVAIQR